MRELAVDTSATPSTVISLETHIVAVTVYTDQALITRRGKITLTGQEQALTLTHLPLTLKPESVRASGVGNVAVQLRDVQAERIYATEPVVDRIAQITAQIEALSDEKQTVEDRIAADAIQRKFVEGLSEKAVDRFSRSLAQQQVSLAETRNLLNFVGQRYGDLSATIAQHNRELTQLTKQIQALHQQLYQVQTPRPKESYSLTVGIVPAGAGEFELEISYVCGRASWKPLYDLRVDSTDSRVHLTYLAEVTQTTGEDWSTVALTLSTAKPGLGTLPPKLTPWYVDVYQPLPPSAPAPMMFRNRAVASAAPGGNDDSDTTLIADSYAFEST
ncbi:MAG TPA: mucoidy inhibitor MuiA family protein, partial [Crinalium sp.]